MARGTDAGSGWRRRGHEDTVVAFPEAITGQAQSFASDASCSWQSVVRSPVSSVPAAAVDFASVLPGSSELLTSPHAPPPSSATMVKLAKVRGPARADTGGEACCLRGARAPRRGGGPARNPGSVRGRHAGGKSRATSGRSRGVWPLDLMVRRAEAGSGRRLWGAPGVAACVCRAREGGGTEIGGAERGEGAGPAGWRWDQTRATGARWAPPPGARAPVRGPPRGFWRSACVAPLGVGVFRYTGKGIRRIDLGREPSHPRSVRDGPTSTWWTPDGARGGLLGPHTWPASSARKSEVDLLERCSF